MELHAKHALEVILGGSTAPHELVSKELKKEWNNCEQNDKDILLLEKHFKFDWKEVWGSHLEMRALEVYKYCSHALKTNVFLREDCKEICKLAYLYLGGGAISEIGAIQVPGAFHNARFMAKGIYTLKMAIFQDAFPFLDTKQRLQVNRIINFIALYYVPWFLTS